jgi:capsular exopolysaccharide synthesis family protein
MWDYGKPLSRPLEEIVSRPSPEAQLALLHTAIQSTDFLRRIIVTTGLDKNESSLAWARSQQSKYPEATLEELTELRNIQLLRNLIRADTRGDNVFRIVVDYSDPITARTIAQSIGNGFVDAARNSQMEQVRAAQEFSIEQRTLYKQKLAEAERKLEEFQRRALTREIASGPIDRTSLPRTETLRDRAASELDDARSLRDTFGERAADLSAGAAARLPALTSAELAAVRGQIVALEKQAARAIATTPAAAGASSASPQDAQIARKRQEAAAEIRRLVAREFGGESKAFQDAAERAVLAEVDVAAVEARRDAYQEMIGQFMSQVAGSPERQIELQRLQQEVDVNREFYNAFLKEIAAKQIAAAFEVAQAGGKVVILEPPALPLKPYKPNRIAIALLSALGGVLAGIGFVILVETHDTSLHDADEVREHLDVEVLGSLPRLAEEDPDAASRNGGRPGGDGGAPEWPMPEGRLQPAPWIREAYATESPGGYEFRRLVLRLTSKDNGGGPRIVLITSARRGEGKSTVAALFALALARKSNQRVLLIDYDLRRPSLHRVFGLPADHPGVVDAIRDRRLTTDHVEELLPGRLSLIPAGRTEEVRSEFLEPEAAAWLVGQVRGHYTHVVIDSAPNLPVPDAMVLGREADKVLYVLRMGSTPRDLARWGIEQQRQAKDNVAGVVLNDVEKVLPYYAGYRDYYSYYDDRG